MEDVLKPEPSEGEALVEVLAAGINPSDVKNVFGAIAGTTLPQIPGRDFAGVVVDGPVGSKGREVWGTDGDIGFARDGSNAQELRVAGVDSRRLDVTACAKLLAEMAPGFQDGRLQPDSPNCYPLEQAREAYMQSIQGKGRLCLLPNA